MRGKFPLDLIEPVAKGDTGGDIVQTVNSQLGTSAGVILWELKNTKSWSDTWLPKLRDNKRAARGSKYFGIETPWICQNLSHPSLMSSANNRKSQRGITGSDVHPLTLSANRNTPPLLTGRYTEERYAIQIRLPSP